MSLSADAISFMAIEETGSKLWYEFLSGYFNGQQHEIAGESAVFPTADLNFQQSKIKQELDGVSIHVVFSSGKTRHCAGMTKNYNKATWTFTVRSRVKTTRSDKMNSEALARRTSDLLYALLDSKAELQPLRDKGIHHIKPSPAIPSESADYRMRTISVSTMLIYARQVTA